MDIDEKGLARLFEGLPDDFEARRDAIVQLRTRFHEMIAELIEPGLNAWLRLRNPQSLDDRKALCKRLNSELSNLGLAIRCPKTGRPASIHAEAQDGERVGSSRFRLLIRSSHPVLRTSMSYQLPVLQLMPDAHPPDMGIRSDGPTKARGR